MHPLVKGTWSHWGKWQGPSGDGYRMSGGKCLKRNQRSTTVSGISKEEEPVKRCKKEEKGEQSWGHRSWAATEAVLLLLFCSFKGPEEVGRRAERSLCFYSGAEDTKLIWPQWHRTTLLHSFCTLFPSSHLLHTDGFKFLWLSKMPSPASPELQTRTSSCLLGIFGIRIPGMVITSMLSTCWVQSQSHYLKGMGKGPGLKALPTAWPSALPGPSHKSGCGSVPVTCTSQRGSRTFFYGLSMTLGRPRSDSASKTRKDKRKHETTVKNV